MRKASIKTAPIIIWSYVLGLCLGHEPKDWERVIAMILFSTILLLIAYYAGKEVQKDL